MSKMRFDETEIKESLLPIKELDKNMYEYLLEKIEFNRLQRFKKASRQMIRRYLARGMREYQKRISINDIISIINRPSSKKKILYVSALPTFNLVRQSIYLRKTGEFETILLMESPWLGEFTEKYFDTVYVYSSCYSLANILKEVNPYIIHVLGCSFYSEFHGVLSRILNDCAVIFEFYDVASLCVNKEDPDAAKVWGKMNVELMVFSERFVCERCDGIILGYSPEALGILKNRHNTKVPMLEFHAYACDRFSSHENGKYLNMDGKIHLVMGGSVSPTDAPNKFFGDSKYLGLIEKITAQGICFDIYYSPHFSPTKAKKKYWDYLLMAQKNPLFKFEKGVPPDEVTKIFSMYDFGTMVSFFHQGTFLDVHNHNRLPGRLFTYLEAGLPMIVSEEMQYLSRIIKEYEIGIVVSQKDLDNLPVIINSYDREKLKTNVKRAREELSMKRHIKRLVAFYEEVHG